MPRLASTAVALIILSSPALALTGWMPFDRAEGERRIRASIERLGAIAPIPPLSCQAAQISTRRCSVEVERGLVLEIVTTPASQRLDQDMVRLFAADDASGAVYEMRLRLDSARHSRPAASSYFDDLCPAMMLAAGIARSPNDARRRFEATFRRAVNRSASDGKPEVVKGSPASLLIEANTSGWATCTISASPIYR